MNGLGNYKKHSLVGGWTRIDMLLQVYDLAIGSLEACKVCFEQHDAAGYARHLVEAQKAMLVIHSGLKPDESEVAFNVARLLHFAMVAIEKADFVKALNVLGQLRQGYAAISDEANELERSGEIPPMPAVEAYQSIA